MFGHAGGFVERAALERWIDRYVRAWESNDPDDIGALFAGGARYFTAPHRDPWVGRDGIVAGWLERRDEPGNWQFRHEVLAVAEFVGFVQGRTRYREPPVEYANLWVIRLDEAGRCSEFTEWWMEVAD